jgi:hypothetical protein
MMKEGGEGNMDGRKEERWRRREGGERTSSVEYISTVRTSAVKNSSTVRTSSVECISTVRTSAVKNSSTVRTSAV